MVIDAVHNPAGKVVGFAKITRDVTEGANSREQLLRENDRLTETIKVWTAAKVVADEAKALAVEAKAGAAQEKVIADEATTRACSDSRWLGAKPPFAPVERSSTDAFRAI